MPWKYTSEKFVDRCTKYSLCSVPIMNLAVISITTLHVIASFTLMTSLLTTKYTRVTSRDKVVLLMAAIITLPKTPNKQLLSWFSLASKLTQTLLTLRDLTACVDNAPNCSTA